MERLFLCLAGNPNSGKSDVAKHIAAKYGFGYTRPSSIIREYAEPRGLPLTERRDYPRAYLRMVDEFGPDYPMQRMLGLPEQNVCVDGERIVRNIERLREFGVHVVTVALWCPLDVRLERAKGRGAARDKLARESFRAEELEEYQSGEAPYVSVLDTMQMADYHLDASQSPEKVLSDMDVIVCHELGQIALV